MAWRGHSATDGQESPGLSPWVGRVPGAVLGLVWDRLSPVPRDLHAERLVWGSTALQGELGYSQVWIW